MYIQRKTRIIFFLKGRVHKKKRTNALILRQVCKPLHFFCARGPNVAKILNPEKKISFFIFIILNSRYQIVNSFFFCLSFSEKILRNIPFSFMIFRGSKENVRSRVIDCWWFPKISRKKLSYTFEMVKNIHRKEKTNWEYASKVFCGTAGAHTPTHNTPALCPYSNIFYYNFSRRSFFLRRKYKFLIIFVRESIVRII